MWNEPRSEKEENITIMVVLAFHTLWSLPQGLDSTLPAATPKVVRTHDEVANDRELSNLRHLFS